MGKAKKVLFTSHTANFHKFNRPFMRMLKEQGYTVHYASAGEEKVYDTDKHFDIPFERSPFKPGNIKAYFKLKKIIDREKYDLIHTHTPVGSVITRLAARNTRKRGTRVIYTNHGAHFLKGGPLSGWLLWFPIEYLCSLLTDEIVVINHEDYATFSKYVHCNVSYLNGGVGVDMKKFQNKRISIRRKIEKRKKLNIASDDYVLIYIAELIPRKNHTMIISAMRRLISKSSKFHLLLVGEDSMNGKIQSMVRSVGIEANVHFLGYRKDVPELLGISDLSVTTSKQEGLGLGILEALASGLPVVATRIRGHSEAVGSIELVDLYDVEELASVIAGISEGEISPKRILPKKFHLESSKKFHMRLYGL